MKVLFVSHHLRGDDGWSRYARDLIKSIQTEGVEVLCLVSETSSEKGLPEQKCLLGPLLYLVNPINSFRSALAVRRVIREFSPDVIQFVVEPYGTMIPFLPKDKVKIVLNAHSTYAFLPALVSGIRRLVAINIAKRVYKRVDAVICISKYTAGYLEHRFEEIKAPEALSSKIVIMGGGVDLSAGQFYIPRSNSGPKEILLVGAVKPRKGVLEALDALAQIKFDFIFRIAGVYKENDGYVRLIKSRIIDLGLENKVVLEGRVDEERLKSLYKKADLFLMLSTNNGADFEGYGLVYLEANSYGVPCIGPKDSGVSDAIEDGKTGYLVDQYNPTEVAEAINKVLIHRAINPMDCVNWAKENSIENRAKVMISVYKKLLTK